MSPACFRYGSRDLSFGFSNSDRNASSTDVSPATQAVITVSMFLKSATTSSLPCAATIPCRTAIATASNGPPYTSGLFSAAPE